MQHVRVKDQIANLVFQGDCSFCAVTLFGFSFFCGYPLMVQFMSQIYIYLLFFINFYFFLMYYSIIGSHQRNQILFSLFLPPQCGELSTFVCFLLSFFWSSYQKKLKNLRWIESSWRMS